MEKQLSFLENKPTHKIKKQSPTKKQKATPSKTEKFQLFTDGASKGNPGPSGAGMYLEKNEKEVFGKDFYLGEKTNNQAEYLALCLGIFYFKKELKKQKKKTATITIISDSQLLVRQMIGFYKVKDPVLQNLKALAQSLLEDIDAHFKHVLRAYNKKADALANKAVEQKSDSISKEFLSLLKKHNLENLLK